MAAGVDDTTGFAPVGAHPVVTALAGVREAIARAAEQSFWSPSDAEVVAALGQVLAARSGLEAVTASLVGQAESRVLRDQLTQVTTTGWLRRRFQLSLAEAKRLTGLAALLPRWGQVSDALVEGRLSAEAAAAITTVLTDLPDTATADELSRAEALLVTQAATLDPAELALCGQALREALTVTPDVDDPAEAERVAKELADAEAGERTAWDRRALRLIRRRDGMLGIIGALDALSGAQVREILEAAARPPDAVEGVRDDRNPGQRLADALFEAITTTGPLDLDHDAGMTPRPRPDHSSDEGSDHPGSDDPDDGSTDATPAAAPDGAESHDPDQAADGFADPDHDAEDCDDLQDLDDAADCEDAGDLDDLYGGDIDAAEDTEDAVVEGDPVLDFGDGFTGAPDPSPDPDGSHGVGGHGADDTSGGCCAGANRADRRAQGHHRNRRRPPATARPTVTASLIINWDSLQAGLPAAGVLPDGTPLTPTATLTALCDAGVLPMVFTGPGQPLHLGRYRRDFTPAQRRALAARDRGCTFPGCHRRAAVSQAHHLLPWEHGGPTDLTNGALLCRYHHQVVHREGWEGRLDAHGRPEYRPPAALDPERRPRQHLRFATPDTTAA